MFLGFSIRSCSRKLSSSAACSMDLKDVVKVLEKIAPSRLAEKWDNVGLLIEPTSPHRVRNILLTNDLTEDVMRESIAFKADMIISYHPPIFRPLKRVTSESWKERLVVSALENRIAVYSPHTASDAVVNGVNDWLASGIGEIRECQPINPVSKLSSGGLVYLKQSEAPDFPDLSKSDGESIQVLSQSSSGILAYCSDVLNTSKELGNLGISSEDMEHLQCSNQIVSKSGAGRFCQLTKPLTLKDILQNLKRHLNLKHLRLALGRGKTLDSLVQTVALCAGSGSSVLSGCAADTYLSGEMSHHEVLDATQNGISVILCEHSNSERGYLHVLRDILINSSKGIDLNVVVATSDKDPLEVV